MQEISESAADRQPNPTRRLFLVLGVVVGILLVCGVASLWLRNYFADQVVKAELAKAKAAGMLTTLEDVKKFIGPAPDESQNAARFYREMTALKGEDDLGKLSAIRKELFESPSDKTIVAAKQLLASNRQLIGLAEEAAKRPACYFDHDWSLGYSLLFPHLSVSKQASQLLLTRAQIAAYEKRDDAAIEDIRRVRAIARHLSQDKTVITKLVSLAITSLAVRVTTHTAAQNPPGSVWIKELLLMEKEIAVPTYQESAALDLFSDLMMFKDVKTQESREKRIGLKREEVPPVETRLMAAAIAQGSGLRNTIAGRLMIWKELGKEDSIDWTVVAAGASEVNRGYLSDPYLITISQGLGIDDIEMVREPRERAIEKKLLIQAAVRVLGQSNRRILPDFSDLVSPVDDMPMKGHTVGNDLILSFQDPIDPEDGSRSLKFKLFKSNN